MPVPFFSLSSDVHFLQTTFTTTCLHPSCCIIIFILSFLVVLKFLESLDDHHYFCIKREERVCLPLLSWRFVNRLNLKSRELQDFQTFNHCFKNMFQVNGKMRDTKRGFPYPFHFIFILAISSFQKHNKAAIEDLAHSMGLEH